MRCPRCNSRKFKVENFREICDNCLFSRSLQRETISTSGYHYGSDKTSNIVRNSDEIVNICYHNVAYKYPIIRDNPQVSLPIKIKMRGWIKEQKETENVTIQRTPKSVIFYLKKRITVDLRDREKAVREAETFIHREAQAFSSFYGIVLGEAEPLSKEVKIIEPFLPAGSKFTGKIAKSVYNTGQVEFTDPEKAMDHTKNFVENMAILNRVDRIENAMTTFAVGMEQHMILINELQNTAKSMDNAVKNITPLYLKLWSKIKRFFRCSNTKMANIDAEK